MAEIITLEILRIIAERAGLRLSDDELQRLLPGVNRARRQVAELREIIERAGEPAGAFNAANAERK